MNKSDLSSILNTVLSLKPLIANRLLLMVLFFVNSTFGQITQPLAWTKAYDQTSLTGTGTSFSIASGTNRILVVGVTTAFDDDNGSGTQADPAIVSYGGVTLTKATGNGTTSGRMHTWLYFLKDNAVMDATSRPLNVTGGTITGATLANMTVWYAVYTGVDQTPATYTNGNGLNNSSPNNATAALSGAMTVNTNEQAVYISNIYNDNSGTTPSYTINANWTSGGFNTGTNTSGGNTVAWKVQLANRAIPTSNTTDAATTSTITPNGDIRSAMSAMSLPKFVYSVTSVSVPTAQCLSTATVTVNGTAAGLPVGMYTVTYSRNDPSVTGLTAMMNVTTAGTGTFTATGLTNADNAGTRITVTNLSTGSYSNAITVNNVSNTFVMRGVLSEPSGLNGYSSGSCTSYTVQWNNGAPRVTNYYLDVSTSSTFVTFLTGYDNKDLGTSFSHNITGLTSGTPYFWRVRSANVCGTTASTATQTFTLGPSVAPIGNGATTVCVSTTTPAFTNATVGGVWSITSGTGTASITTGGVVTGLTAGTVTVNYSVTSSGCTSRATTALTVNSNLPSSVAIAASPSGAICSGTSVTFTATPTNGGTTPSYQWKLNGVNVGTNSSTYANAALANGNTVTCVMTSIATCATGSPATSNVITATVNATPTITGTVTPATCSNGSDGAITITGLSAPIEFKKADNDHIDLGSSLLNNRAKFTIEGWIKFNIADVGARMSLFGQNNVIEFFLNSTTIQLYTAGGGGITTPLTAAFGNNTWHHIAATGDGTNLRIYIDGALVATGGSTTSNYGTSTETSKIGSGVVDGITYTTGGGGGFTGQMQKVGFYSTALLPATITSLATSPTTYLGTETGLIAGYNFFEGSGTTLTKLPAGTNGTFGNSPQWAYTFAWTKTGTPAYSASTKNISDLSPGDYNLSISGGQCPIAKTFTVGATNTTPSTPIVGTTIQPNCTVPTGSVVLSDLPAGNWTINPGGITGNTSSATISGLTANTYNFTVTNSTGCSSSATGNVVINPAVTNTWNGSVWSQDTPNSTQKIVFSGDYPPAVDPNVNITGCSCMITGGATVTIKSGRTLTITNEVTVVGGGKLTFEDTASLVQINNAPINSGDIIYKRTTSSVLNSDYTYWSSPVANQNLNISPSYGSGMFYSYNDFAVPEDWQKETASTTMQIGKGYIIRGPQVNGPPPPPGLYDAIFVGVPNNGIKTIDIGPTGTSNLLGNPYPSAIDADDFLAANSTIVEGTIYFWTHNTAIQLASGITNGTAGSGAMAYTSDDYASYNGTGGAATSGGITPNGKIAAGQAFFTTSIATGATVTFSNTMRLAGTTLADKTGTNQQFFKTKNPDTKTASIIEKNRIWLDLSNNQGAFKQTLIGYVTDATNDYDSRFDGESFDGNEFVDFYSINQDKNLVIQGRALPFDENDEVPLGFRSTIEGSFTINIDQVDGLLANQPVFIEDKLTNTVFDLKRGNYTFNTVSGTFNDRFVLRYTNKTLGTNDLVTQSKQLLISVKNKQIKINSFSETIDKVTIYDVLGRQIYQNGNVNSNEFLITNLVSSHQTLIVKTSLQNGKTVTDKIIY